jgi:predicted Fe-S protein YdhL (DUF1289 family)
MSEVIEWGEADDMKKLHISMAAKKRTAAREARRKNT